MRTIETMKNELDGHKRDLETALKNNMSEVIVKSLESDIARVEKEIKDKELADAKEKERLENVLMHKKEVSERGFKVLNPIIDGVVKNFEPGGKYYDYCVVMEQRSSFIEETKILSHHRITVTFVGKRIDFKEHCAEITFTPWHSVNRGYHRYQTDEIPAVSIEPSYFIKHMRGGRLTNLKNTSEVIEKICKRIKDTITAQKHRYETKLASAVKVSKVDKLSDSFPGFKSEDLYYNQKTERILSRVINGVGKMEIKSIRFSDDKETTMDFSIRLNGLTEKQVKSVMDAAFDSIEKIKEEKNAK